MADRGRPFPPDSVDLDAFLFEGTEAQSRALAGLKWLAKAEQLDYDLSAYDFRGQPQREARQAAVAEPPMLALLERQIEQLYNSRNPQWRAMLRLWACGFGVLRLVHLSRASPRRLSRSTFHFHCGRGKQKGNRHGFDFAIPVHLMSGWDWASRWLEDWQDLPASKRATSGLNFSEHGVPYTTPQTVRIAQDLFTPLLGGSVAALTSYSFRRVGPTDATLAGWTPQNQLALGDWQDKTRAKGQGNTMPLRYSGTRYTTSVRRKHFLLTAVAGLLKYNRWDEIPSKVLEAAEREGALGMDRAVQQDNHTKWQGQIGDDEMAPRFRLPSVVPLPVAGHAMMPRQMGGKRLSATLRDGVLLCAAFQSGNCAHER